MTQTQQPVFSLEQARQIALTAQGFGMTTSTKARTSGKTAGPRALRGVMNRLHLLQLDSVPVIARTQYLPAFSRYGVYSMPLLDKLAYENDEWFEAWSHEASLLPVRFEPLLRWIKQRALNGEVWPALRNTAREHAAYVNSVLHEVRSRGPLKASELSDPRPHAFATGWGRGSMGSLALDWLFRIGEVGIRRTGNFEKSYDLLERIVPPDVLNQPTPTEHEAISELLVLATQAHGLGTATDLADYFRIPIKPARLALDELQESGRVLRCEVEGWKHPAYCLPGLKAPGAVNARALLSPFDPVVWRRDRAERLFNFEYRLEIYTPEKKRRWGYYVLPFLLGNQVVARVDLKNDRAASVLHVPAAHIEAAHDSHEVASALAAELALLAQFLGCQRIVAGRRGNLMNALRQTLRLR